MPKRKRNPYGEDASPEEKLELKKKNVEKKLFHGRTLLHRALKTAKGFERQKLGKRMKQKTDVTETARLQREVDALKTIDLDEVAAIHLNKSLLKAKRIAESELLPKELKTASDKDASLSAEDKMALANIAARMFNTKPVKEVMAQVMTSMYQVMGLPNPNAPSKDGGKKTKEESMKQEKELEADEAEEEEEELEDADSEEDEEAEDDGEAHRRPPKGANEPAWEGFESGSISGSDAGLEDYSRYDDLIGGSSDEDGDENELDPMVITDDEDENEGEEDVDAVASDADSQSSFPTEIPPSKTKTKPSPSSSAAKRNQFSRSGSPSPSPPPSKKPKPQPTSAPRGSAGSPPPKRAKSKPASASSGSKVAKGSTFLPTLNSGYWSGTESDPESDDEALDRATGRKNGKEKKNRMGQQARRALAERKFGKEAKHLLAESKVSGKDWDPKRGARDSSASTRGRGRGRGGFGGGVGRGGGTFGSRTVAGGGAKDAGVEVKLKRNEGKGGKRDDVGALHPSWEAAKRAKELKKVAVFEGKKVVFD